MEQIEIQSLINWVDVSRVNQILIELIRLSSENPGGTKQSVASYCKNFLERLGYEVQLIELKPEHNNVVARFKGAVNLLDDPKKEFSL